MESETSESQFPSRSSSKAPFVGSVDPKIQTVLQMLTNPSDFWCSFRGRKSLMRSNYIQWIAVWFSGERRLRELRFGLNYLSLSTVTRPELIWSWLIASEGPGGSVDCYVWFNLVWHWPETLNQNASFSISGHLEPKMLKLVRVTQPQPPSLCFLGKFYPRAPALLPSERCER